MSKFLIEVKGVRPIPRELRPIKRGWGSIHWIACLPLSILMLGLLALSLSTFGLRPDDGVLQAAATAIMIGVLLLWMIAQGWVQRVMINTHRTAPGGVQPSDWLIGDTGVRFSADRLWSSEYLWSAIKAVREEEDRFIFLIVPSYNPVLPKRQMTEGQVETLRTLVSEETASGRLGRGVD